MNLSGREWARACCGKLFGAAFTALASVAVLWGSAVTPTPAWAIDGPLEFIEVQKNGVDGVKDLIKPRAIVVARDNSRLYAAGDKAIVIFEIDKSDGSLSYLNSFVPEDPEDLGRDPDFTGLASSTNGHTLYATARAHDQLLVLERSSAGLELIQTLSDDGAEPASSIEQLENPIDVLVVKGSKTVYVAASGNEVEPQPADILLNPQPASILVFNREPSSGLLSLVEVWTSEDLQLVDPAFEDGLEGLRKLAAPGNGKHLYALGEIPGSETDMLLEDPKGVIAVFGRQASDGTLTPIQVLRSAEDGLPGFKAPTDLVISPNHKHVYVALGDHGHTILIFGRANGSGLLTFIKALELEHEGNGEEQNGDEDHLGDLRALAITPDGKYLLAVTRNPDGLAIFERDNDSGLLSLIAFIDEDDEIEGLHGLDNPRDVVVSQSGGHIYVAAEDDLNGEESEIEPNDGTILVFRRLFPVYDIFAAALPSSRSIQADGVATAFVSVANGRPFDASGCTLEPATFYPGSFKSFQTDPATNAVIGSANATFSVPARGYSSFLIELDPSEPFDPIDLAFAIDCDETAPAPMVRGVNKLTFVADAEPVPDVIAISATPSGDGIALVPLDGWGYFGVAGLNIGVSAQISVTPVLEDAGLPVLLSICELGSEGCKAAPVTSLTADFGAAPLSFAVFVDGTGETIPQNLATSRVTVEFRDTGDVLRGSTGVAVQSAPAELP